MPPKWLQVIDLMIVGNLEFQAAMETVGYSESYYKSRGYEIRQDERFCKLYEQKMHRERTKNVDVREKHLNFLDSVRMDDSLMMRDRLAAIKEYASISGWHSETIRHETTERQAVLDATQQQEMSRLALLALDTRALSDILDTRHHVQSIVTSSTIPIDIDGESQSAQPIDNEADPEQTENPD